MYNKTGKFSPLFKQFKIDRVIRGGLRFLTNLLIPIVLRLSKNIVLDSKGESNRIIVSLTTFPARINNLWIVLECIFRQTIKPNLIYLVLSKKQYPTISSVPSSILKMRERGLIIELIDEDLKSHNKYFYAMQKFPNDIIVTFDDDVFYDTKIIEDLYKTHLAYPECICANQCRKIIVENNMVKPYLDWPMDYELIPSTDLLAMGVGVVLYPPGALSSKAFNASLIKSICPKADDIWLYVMERFAGNKIVPTGKKRILIDVYNCNNVKLSTMNCAQGLNDKQINDINVYIKSEYNTTFNELVNNCRK